MLGKLIKHEFKATYKIFLMLDLALIILTVINKLTMSMDTGNSAMNILQGGLGIAYVIAIIASGIATIVLIIMNFYKTMLSEQGYLTFTLPVTAGQLLFSKIIAAVVWIISNVVSILLSILIMAWDVELINKIWRVLNEAFGVINATSMAWGMILAVILSLISYPFIFFCAMSIGQLFSRHKIIGSVAGYFIINFVSQIVSTVVLFVVSGTFGTVNIDSIDDVSNAVPMYSTVFWVTCGITIILDIVYFIVSKTLLEKKLNID